MPDVLAPARAQLSRDYAAWATTRRAAFARALDAQLSSHKSQKTAERGSDDFRRAASTALASVQRAERSDGALAALIAAGWSAAAIARLRAELARLGLSLDVALSDPLLLAHIEEHAHSAADGIEATLAADLGRYLAELDAADAAGDEPFDSDLAAHKLDGWLAHRDGERAGLIGISEAGLAGAYAQRQFVTRNHLTGQARCVPTDAACDRCGGYIDQGSVPLDEALGWDLPVHPRCPHELAIDYDYAGDGSDLWRG